MTMPRLTPTLLALLCGGMLLPMSGHAQGPAPRVNGVSADQAKTVDKKLVDKLINDLECRTGQKCDPTLVRSRTRGFKVGAGEAVATPTTEAGRRNLELDAKTRALPTSDVEVYFPFNSAELVAETRRTLDSMASALKSQRLAASAFAIIGHTDASGGDDYNQGLSERRAAAVRDYLSGAGGITSQRLSAWGRGKTELKVPSDPLSGANRRVQLINTGATSSSPPPDPPLEETVTGSSPTPPRPTAQRPQQGGGEDCRVFVPAANTTINCEQ